MASRRSYSWSSVRFSICGTYLDPVEATEALAQVTLLRDSLCNFGDGRVGSGASVEVWGPKADVVKTRPLACR